MTDAAHSEVVGRAISNGVARGVRRGLAKAAPTIVDVCLNALWDHPWFTFIAGGQMRLIEAGMKPREAWDLSRRVLIEWVRTERVAFGDPRFCWGAAGGREIVEECEIQYWDKDPS